MNYKISPVSLKYITKIERFQGMWNSRKHLSPVSIESLSQSTIITSSGASTRIEGAKLTDEQVKEFVEKGCKISRISSRSECDVASYIEALNYIYNNYENLQISEYNIRKLHQLINSKLLEEQLPSKQRGVYKDVSNDIIEKNNETGEEVVLFRTTPPGSQTETAMTSLINDYHELVKKDQVHPLIITASFIVNFLAINPFSDGNGRLARLLTLLLLLKFDYNWCQFVSHEKVIEENKEEYYFSLRDTQKTLFSEQVEYTRWIEFFLKVLSIQSDILSAKLVNESTISEFNNNERIVFDIIKENGKCNIGFILEQVDMSRDGLKSLLTRLVVRGFVESSGRGRGTLYLVK